MLGQICAFVGLSIALSGVVSMKRKLFPAHPLPYQRAVEWVRGLFQHERKAQSVQISLGGAISASGHVSAELITARPSTYAPDEAWIRHFDERLKNIDAWRVQHQKDTAARFEQLDMRLVHETTNVARRVADLDRKYGRALGGHEGRGFNSAFWGLFTTVGGVVLQIVALVIHAYGRS